ncbi:MAG: hypothetical protein H8E82_05520 [Candidatus Marinimicrobia bacterium]|nr:hypothetical protein [Candidatus Neomarinimicrobiota bacterium]MBL7046798.1 hypothetical protein [Candidatus Neomarinimicrobiota bacterium]
MAEIVVYAKDFKLGTKIAETAAQFEKEIVFPEHKDISEEINVGTIIVIVDLDDDYQQTLLLVKNIRHSFPAVPIVGILTRVQKSTHDRARESGCTLVLPRFTFIKNLTILIEKGLSGKSIKK